MCRCFPCQVLVRMLPSWVNSLASRDQSSGVCIGKSGVHCWVVPKKDPEMAGLYPLDKEWEELHSKPSRLAISVVIGSATKAVAKIHSFKVQTSTHR